MTDASSSEVDVEEINKVVPKQDSASNVEIHVHNDCPAEHTNVLAIVAIVVVWFFFPVGLVCGHLALSQIRESGEGGRTAAIVALVVCYIDLACAVFFLIVYIAYLGSIG